MKRVYLTVFLVSCSILVFEISLTRIFSITLWYHFAFMVISIAMLGIGSAGTVLALCSGKRDRQERVTSHSKSISDLIYSESNIPFYAVFTGIAILMCFIASNYIPFDPVRLSWDRFQLLYFALYCLTLSIPFFFAGILIATVFTFYSDRSMSVYSWDLIGAGTGSLLVLALLNMAAPEYAVLSASTLCLTGVLLSGKRKAAVLSVIFLLLNMFLFFQHPDFITIKMSQYKNLPVYLRYPGAEHLKTYHSSYSRIDVFKSPGIRFAPGLSLKYLKALPDQTGLATDGNRVDVITGVRDTSREQFLEFLPASLAYETGKKDKVLILDPRGGMHVRMAKHYGVREIHKVERDPFFLRIVKDDFREFGGNLYESDTWTGYGRNYLHQMADSSDTPEYNLIDIPMTGTSVSGTFGIFEDYRFTVDAFNRYIHSLEKNGILSISLYLIPPPRTEYRILATVITALEQNGIRNVHLHIAAIRSWDSMTILVKKSSFTVSELDQIRQFSHNRNFDPVYYPGIQKEESGRFIKTPSNDLFNGFRSIINPKTRPSFISEYLFDIRPVYDGNPFFHYFLKFDNVKSIYDTMGRKLLYFINEGYLLPVILIMVSLLSFFIILLPVTIHAIRKGAEPALRPAQNITIACLVYFGMLGLGFMFVEVTIIQKAILILENPAYSVSFVLISILLSSGVGSMCGSRFSILQTPGTLLILSILISLFALIQPFLFSRMTALSLPLRIPALLIAVIPMGFFMGIPFPMGIRLIGQRREALIPWAWAVNACLSVLAPILTIMIALVAGFHSVLWMSVIAYVVAYSALMKLRRCSCNASTKSG